MKIAAVHRPPPRLVAMLLLATLLAGTGAAMAQGHAQRDHDDRGGRNEARQVHDHALADAVRRVERATRGEVLSAERVQSDGRDVSRVKVVDASGRVRVYMDDAQPRERRDQRSRRDDSHND